MFFKLEIYKSYAEMAQLGTAPDLKGESRIEM